MNELPACTCRLEACFAIKCTRSASICCNFNVNVSFFSYFCLDQGDVFDKVTTTIEVQDENNNRPVFTQNIFIGGEDIAVSRPFSVTLQTSVNGKVFDASPLLNRDPYATFSLPLPSSDLKVPNDQRNTASSS